MKRIESPSKKWAGYVLLHDPLSLEMVIAIEDAREKLTELEPSKLLEKVNEELIKSGKDQISVTWSSRSHKVVLPVLLDCVEEWHLENFPDNPNVDNFPASPRKDASELVNWLWDEIDNVYTGEVEVPNES